MSIPADTCNVIAKAKTPIANASTVVDPGPTKIGSVILRGVAVALDAAVGQAFVIDCARNTEGLMPDSDVKNKWALTDKAWKLLAYNSPLLQAVQAERERRVRSGDAPREAAQRHFAKAPAVLGDILTDGQVSPRHRIEAARELRQVAGDGPDTTSGAGEKFIITINLGADERLFFEHDIAPRSPAPSDDGEMP